MVRSREAYAAYRIFESVDSFALFRSQRVDKACGHDQALTFRRISGLGGILRYLRAFADHQEAFRGAEAHP